MKAKVNVNRRSRLGRFRPRARVIRPTIQRRACKLCKRMVDLSEGVFFENGQTGRLSDFQCRTCTAWELAPEGTPGNVRTDLVHYA